MMEELFDIWSVSEKDEFERQCMERKDKIIRIGFEKFDKINMRAKPFERRRYEDFLVETASVLSKNGFDKYEKKYNERYRKTDYEIEDILVKIENTYESCLIEMNNRKAIKELEKVIDMLYLVGGRLELTLEPRIYGLLGLRYHKARKKWIALMYTRWALDICSRNEDIEGVAIYKRNIELIEKRKLRKGHIVLSK